MWLNAFDSTIANTHHTSDASIARSISVVKSSLREASPGAELLIKTEYGRGYRFIGDVSFCKKNAYKDPIKQKLISHIASKDILHCETNTTILEAAHLLHHHQKSSVIVNRNNQSIGIWTEADALTLDLSDPSVLETNICKVMYSPIITIQEWKPISDAVLKMRSSGIRHLLVVDRHNKASGVVSQTDLVRNHGVESFLTVKDVKSVSYKSPLVVTENLQVYEVVRMMRLRHTDISIISLQGREMFPITERDIVGLIAKKRLNIFVNDLDNKPIITVTEDTTLLAARQLMEIQQIRHLVVLDHAGKLLKVLGLADILQVIEDSYVHLLEDILEENKRIIAANENHIQMLTNAVQQTAGMILIADKFGNIEYVNKSFEDISGYTLEEVKGLNPRFLKSGSTQPDVFQSLWQTLNSGQTWKGELCNQSKSGSIYWVLASITPMYDEQGQLNHYVALEEDITDRIELEKKYKENEQRFHEVVNASPIMFWQSGIDGKIFYLNQFWLEFTGLELADLYGNGWARQIHPNDLNKYLDIFHQAMIKRKAFTIDHRLRDFTGEYRWVMNNGFPHINDNGEFIGFRGFCIDITKRKILEHTI
jgi:PAS domain S-box-containing protein